MFLHGSVGSVGEGEVRGGVARGTIALWCLANGKGDPCYREKEGEKETDS